MMEWPRDPNQCVSFTDITGPLVDSARRLLKVEWDGKDVPYEGFPLGLEMQAGSFNPDEKLKAEQIRYDDEDQGRDPLEVMIGIAVQVGIEQGRRIDRQKNGARTEYEVSEAIEQAAAELPLPREQAAMLAFLVRDKLKRSEDLLTRIHFEHAEKKT
jgi:hypothetical protein